MRKIIILFSIVCVVILAGITLAFLHHKEKSRTLGYVFFLQDNRDYERINNLLIVDADGGMQQYLTMISGTYTVTRDGKFLVAGCYEGLYLCKFMISRKNFENRFDSNYLFVGKLSFKYVVTKYEMPPECSEYNTSELYPTSLNPFSVSLSKDNDKIAIVCGNPAYGYRVFIIDIDNGYLSWEDDDIFSAEWSPIGDEIAISRGEYIDGKVQIVDENGKVKKELGIGLDPAWSPDGTKLAYFTYRFNKNDKENPTNMDPKKSIPGIVIYDFTTGKETWILEVDRKANSQLTFGSNMWFHNRISWSGDMKYLFFSADVHIYPNWGYPIQRIFKMDLDTREIFWISDPSINSYVPVWIEGPR